MHSATTIARFWSKVSVGSARSCWEWRGGENSNGYGTFTLPNPKRPVGAHRVAWEIVNGEPLGERFACHRCDNPKCCNPDHIYAGTRQDNARDAVERNRLPSTAAAGQANGRAKLTNDDVAEIRRRIEAGERNPDIAADFPVSQSMISKIRRGHFWTA